MTPEREDEMRKDAAWGGLPATKQLAVWALVDELRVERDNLTQRFQHVLDRQQELAEGFMTISRNHEKIFKLLSDSASAGRAQAFKQASHAVAKMIFVEKDK